MSTLATPIVYVIRHSDGYALYPFAADVAGLMAKPAERMTASEVLRALQYLPASLVMSSNGAEVLWLAAGGATPARLDAMDAVR